MRDTVRALRTRVCRSGRTLPAPRRHFRPGGPRRSHLPARTSVQRIHDRRWYLMGWAIFTSLMLIAALRTTAVLALLFAVLDVVFVLLALGAINASAGLTTTLPGRRTVAQDCGSARGRTGPFRRTRRGPSGRCR